MMTDTMPADVLASRPRMSIADRLRAALALVIEVYRRGGRTIVLAPLIFAIAVLPEFAQHIAEMQLGMFESREAFAAMAMDPLRWQFAYGKIAGLAIAILATARYWRFGSVRAALLVRPKALLWIALAVAAMLAIDFGLGWVSDRTGSIVGGGVAVVSFLLQTLVQVVVIAALLEDRELTLRRLVTWGWVIAIVQLAMMAAAALPAMGLHTAAHKLAFLTPPAIDWLVMVADSLLVGLIATLIGSALFVGYFVGDRRARGLAD